MIKFISAHRTSENEVNALYLWNESRITVVWNCTDAGTGEKINYYINKVITDDESIQTFLNKVIDIGEKDENPGLDIYLLLRDTFDAQQCDQI